MMLEDEFALQRVTYAVFSRMDWPDAHAAFMHKLPDGREIRLFETITGRWEALCTNVDGAGGCWLRQKRKNWTGWRGNQPPKRTFRNAATAGRAALAEWGD